MAEGAVEKRISAQVPDWSREALRGVWDPGPKLLRTLRRYEAARARGGLFARLASKYWVAVHRVWSVLTQCEIHLGTRIGGGLRLPHPQGIVVHCDAVIGVNCLLFHQVTLAGAVRLGGHVDVGAGAKLLGPLSVGDHAVIGANAVVTQDVPAGAVVAGVPARIIGWQPASVTGDAAAPPERRAEPTHRPAPPAAPSGSM